jgi:hypothetical protein
MLAQDCRIQLEQKEKPQDSWIVCKRPPFLEKFHVEISKLIGQYIYVPDLIQLVANYVLCTPFQPSQEVGSDAVKNLISHIDPHWDAEEGFSVKIISTPSPQVRTHRLSSATFLHETDRHLLHFCAILPWRQTKKTIRTHYYYTRWMVAFMGERFWVGTNIKLQFRRNEKFEELEDEEHPFDCIL